MTRPVDLWSITGTRQRGTVPVGAAMARRHAQRLVEILNARLGA
jgi:hypothetical protein